MTGTITIRGREIPVDIRAELERFDFAKADWQSDRLIAVSPFRYERNPSFSVSLEYGGWRDFGATDSEWASGGFVKLLAFLRQETPAETCDYLTAVYAPEYAADPDELPPLTINIRPAVRKVPIVLPESTLEPYQFRSPYFGGRGISEGVQRLMGVGYDRKARAVVLPWRWPNGKLAAVKYRSTASRAFWYEDGGAPIRELVYGIDVIYGRRIRAAAIVEGEADAMTIMTGGFPSLATGGATNWNAAKRDMIVRSPLEEITLFRDNDAAGKAWARRVAADLAPYMIVKVAVVRSRWKDVNEAGAERIEGAWNRARRLKRMRTVV